MRHYQTPGRQVHAKNTARPAVAEQLVKTLWLPFA
jgi:hypothetical protein